MAARKKKTAARKGGDERDSAGRFKPGNRGGPGNPRVRKLGEFQAAVRKAVTPQELANVLVRMRDIAMDSQDEASAIAAARVLLERCLGKPEAAPRVIEAALDIGDVASPQDLAEARRRVLEAVLSGEIEVDDAAALMGAVDQTAVAELASLSDRMAKLESAHAD